MDEEAEAQRHQTCRIGGTGHLAWALAPPAPTQACELPPPRGISLSPQGASTLRQGCPHPWQQTLGQVGQKPHLTTPWSWQRHWDGPREA